ncbi:MAG TPA: PilZ domain-containing protein [Gammaproteobacteria bacterium]|nr:PilZ domain-containing protein [Gammaproteobacteria bacterium]
MERLERRWSTRKNLYVNVDLHVPAYYSYCKRVIPATLLDISLGGAFIGTQLPLPPDTVFAIKLKIPDVFVRNGFRLHARAVHNTSRGVGVSFVDMRAGLVNVLIEALSRQDTRIKPAKPTIYPGFAVHKALPA